MAGSFWSKNRTFRRRLAIGGLSPISSARTSIACHPFVIPAAPGLVDLTGQLDDQAIARRSSNAAWGPRGGVGAGGRKRADDDPRVCGIEAFETRAGLA